MRYPHVIDKRIQAIYAATALTADEAVITPNRLLVETLVQQLRVLLQAVQRFDREIAERNRENVGCVFLVAQSATVAKLRMLLVEPTARGLGIGSRLVEEVIRFAEQARYRKITLWTNSVLHAARHIYEQAGFQLVAEEPHHSFGHDLVGQTWTLALPRAGATKAPRRQRRDE